MRRGMGKKNRMTSTVIQGVDGPTSVFIAGKGKDSNMQKKIKTDTVTNILQKVDKDKTNNVEKEKFPLVEMEKRSSYKKTKTKKYKITGKSWLDTNKNGKRDEKEKGIENITVKLYNASTNKIVQTNILHSTFLRIFLFIFRLFFIFFLLFIKRVIFFLGFCFLLLILFVF